MSWLPPTPVVERPRQTFSVSQRSSFLVDLKVHAFAASRFVTLMYCVIRKTLSCEYGLTGGCHARPTSCDQRELYTPESEFQNGGCMVSCITTCFFSETWKVISFINWRRVLEAKFETVGLYNSRCRTLLVTFLVKRARVGVCERRQQTNRLYLPLS